MNGVSRCYYHLVCYIAAIGGQGGYTLSLRHHALFGTSAAALSLIARYAGRTARRRAGQAGLLSGYHWGITLETLLRQHIIGGLTSMGEVAHCRRAELLEQICHYYVNTTMKAYQFYIRYASLQPCEQAA